MTISEIIDNEVILYDLKLNKNRLKSIRKKLVAKYGKPVVRLDNEEEDTIIKNEMEDYNINCDGPWYSFKKVKGKNNEILYTPIQHPELAIYISDCLNDPMCFQYITYLQDCDRDVDGMEYLTEILDCITLTEIYRDKFNNSGDLIEKLLVNAPQDSDLRSKIYELKKYILSSSFSALKTEQKLIKKKVQTKDIMITLIKYNCSDRLTTSEYFDLIKFILKELKDKELLDKYEIAFNVNTESLKRVVEYNSDIFVDEIRYSDEIRIRLPEKSEDYADRYFIDETIDGIVRNYCETKNKVLDDLIPEQFVSRPVPPISSSMNFKGAITLNEMSNIIEEQGPILKKTRK